MPRIFDNIDQSLLPVFQGTLNVSAQHDFTVDEFIYINYDTKYRMGVS